MSETTWSHLGILGIIIVPLFLAWLDLRNRQGNMHKENIERLARMETKIEPLWNWWNRNGGPEH